MKSNDNMKLIDKDAVVAEIERLKADVLQKKGQCKRSGLEKIMHQIGAYNKILSFLDTLKVKELQEEPVSEELEEACRNYADDEEYGDDVYFAIKAAFKAGAQWQKEQIEEALLSEVLPCFMHGGEADEVMAKLDDVLNQKK